MDRQARGRARAGKHAGSVHATSATASPTSAPASNEGDILIAGDHETTASRELEARYDALALATGQITWTAHGDDSDNWDRDGRAWRLFPGRTDEDGASAHLSSWLDDVHPGDRERAMTAWAAAVATRTLYEIQYRARRHDGEYRELLVRAAPVLEPDGSVREWAGVATDITERTRTERLLAEQNALLELISAGRPLNDCLDAIVNAIARLCPGARATVVLAGAATAATADSATPPPFGVGLRAAPLEELIIGAFGGALYATTPTTSADIAHDQRISQDWRALCVAHSVLAAHAEPIVGSDGQALASLVLCFDHAREPTEWEARQARLGAHIASIAIERANTDQALRESKEQLAVELDNARLLQRLSRLVDEEGGLEGLYSQLLDAATAIMRSDMGSMQMYVPERDALRLLAWKGFDPAAAAFWEWVRIESSSSCGMALNTRERAIVPDVDTCAYMAGSDDLDFSHLCGIQAVQSTPLLSRDGDLLGMISTHWRTRHEPDERELRLLDVLARQAADLIERTRAQSALRASEARQTYLLNLSDALRALNDPIEIQRTATHVLGERLGASRAVYLIIDDDEGAFTIEGEYHLPNVASMLGRFTLDSFGPSLVAAARAGRSLSVANVFNGLSLSAAERDAYTAIGVMAFAGVPLIKNGRLISILSVHSATPREWFGEELTLIQETAERTWAAFERARAEEAMREANKRKDEFLGIASHELRTPLTSAKANVEMVARRLARTLAIADAEAAPALDWLRPLQPVLERSANALNRLTRLVADLLDVSRIQAGRLEMRPERMDLVRTVREAMEDELQNWPGREVRMVESAAPASVLWIEADPDRIRQVVTNYLSNALKYAAPDQPVTIQVEERDHAARVAVSDRGPGLTLGQQEHLFERFYRVEGITNQNGSAVGLGLGLAICHDIIERHGGTVGIGSAPGAGSTFWFTIPMIASEGEQSASTR